MAAAADVPVQADGSAGYGNSLHIRGTACEKVEVCATRLEDKVFLKRSGHLLDRRIIAIEEVVWNTYGATDNSKYDDDVIIYNFTALTLTKNYFS
jgi:2-methylisocitrate lyase-like PEP mutase family enzyme